MGEREERGVKSCVIEAVMEAGRMADEWPCGEEARFRNRVRNSKCDMGNAWSVKESILRDRKK